MPPLDAGNWPPCREGSLLPAISEQVRSASVRQMAHGGFVCGLLVAACVVLCRGVVVVGARRLWRVARTGLGAVAASGGSHWLSDSKFALGLCANSPRY